MSKRSRATRILCATFSSLAIAITVVSADVPLPAGAAEANISTDRIIPPVKRQGKALEQPPVPGAPVGAKGVSCGSVPLEIAGELNGLLKRAVLHIDRPNQGETGYVEHFLVNVVLVRFQNFLNAPGGGNANKTVAQAFQDPAFKLAVVADAAAYDKAVMANKVRKGAGRDFKDGGKLEVWCLKANRRHGGPELGYFFLPAAPVVPPNAPNPPPAPAGKWIGACVFDKGQNMMSFTEDAMGNLKAAQWVNFEIPDDSVDSFVWHYSFDVAANSLKIEKVWGRWAKAKVQVNGKLIDQWIFGKPKDSNNVTTSETITPAPEDFSKIVFDNRQLTAGCGCGGGGAALARADEPLPTVEGDPAAATGTVAIVTPPPGDGSSTAGDAGSGLLSATTSGSCMGGGAENPRPPSPGPVPQPPDPPTTPPTTEPTPPPTTEPTTPPPPPTTTTTTTTTPGRNV